MNTICNDVTDSYLWKRFSIIGSTAGSILEQITSLLRRPRRASYIQRLVIGPFTFPWTKELIDIFPNIWGLIPNLKDLILNSPYGMSGNRTRGLTFGVDFTPLIRSLAQHGCHIRLRRFKCASWLRPDSDLHRFLQSQNDLRELIGVDLTPSRLVDTGHNFLPCLEVLVCHYVVTAERLLPGRRIRTLIICETLEEDLTMVPLASAIHDSSGSLTTCSLVLFPNFCVDSSVSSFFALCSSLRNVRVIDFDDFDLPEMHRLPAFLSLEQITFRTVEGAVRLNEIAEIAKIGQCLCPLLRCLRFKVGETWWIWNREDLDR